MAADPTAPAVVLRDHPVHCNRCGRVIGHLSPGGIVPGGSADWPCRACKERTLISGPPLP